MLNGIITSNRGLLPTLGGGAAIFDFTSRVAPDPRITFTRASNATDFSSAGVLTTEGNDVARFDFNPLTLQPRGLLVEGARTNLLLNSATLSTQDITVTAVAHTLSFYGTGSITLSGAATGTLNGAGAFPNRATLTFTPSAGTLTVTVTGSVLNAQCEVGAFASSWIPTTGAAATRALDVGTISNLASIGFNATQGTMIVEFQIHQANNNWLFRITDNSGLGTDSLGVTVDSSGNLSARTVNSTVNTFNNVIAGVAINTVQKAAFSYSSAQASICLNGGSVSTDSSITLPVAVNLTKALIGVFDNNTGNLNGWIRRVIYYPTQLPDAQLQALTA